MADELLKRPFIFAGIIAFLPVAATGAHLEHLCRSQFRRSCWQDLHRSSYLVGLLAALQLV